MDRSLNRVVNFIEHLIGGIMYLQQYNTNTNTYKRKKIDVHLTNSYEYIKF